MGETLRESTYAPAEVAAFLDGTAPLDGVWFGERHPTEPGLYWWRKHMRAALQRVEALEEKAAMIDAIRANHWTLRAVDVRHDDDADVAWQVIEYYMAAPYTREIGYGSTPEEAVRDVAKRLATVSGCDHSGDAYDADGEWFCFACHAVVAAPDTVRDAQATTNPET